MKRSMRLLSLLLLLFTILTAFSACSDGDDGSSSVAVTSQEDELFSGLPAKDYGGEEFTILVPGDDYGTYMSCEIGEQTSSPEILNENIRKRNELVESRFGVKITEIRTASNENMVETIRTACISFTDEYDLVMPYIPDAATLALEDMFYLINDYPYIDLNNDCWDKNAIEGLSIRNKSYFVTGDISLLSLACTHAVVFNKDMITQYGLENPYTLVEDGKWTIDKLREMAKNVTSDSDGVTGMSDKDTYGFLVNSNFVTSMFIGSGERLTGKDSDDKPYITVNSASAVSVFTKIFDLVNDTSATGKIDDTTGGYYTSATAGGGSVWDAATASVGNNLALFRAMAIIDIIDLGGNYECNFGILPVPKYNDAQENYYSFVSTLYATCVAIPTSNADPEMASIIAEAMCESSTDTTKYAYYDVILKVRKIKDDDSEAMLDKIFASRVYDLGVVYCWGGTSTYDTNGIGNFMNTVAFSGQQTFASTYESIADKIQTALDETLSAFDS